MRGINDFGFGALGVLKSGDLDLKYPVEVDKPRANILETPLRNHTEASESKEITL